MRRAASLLLLLLASPAAAWDSRCYLAAPVPDPTVRGGLRIECAPGPEAARNRWLGPSDEHRALLDFGRIFGHLPTPVSGDTPLEVFTADDPVDVAGQNLPSLQPVSFAAAKRVQERPMSVPELAQLPDHAYSLWDWALGNETCPVDPAIGAQDCHDFGRHMGPVNSNHFVPQSEFFYAYYHRLALDRAAECATMTMRLGSDAPRFTAFRVACEREALMIEAVGQHFLQDAWATGHMWERWGSPDPADFPTLTEALLVAMASGLIHGARGLLDTLPDLLPDVIAAQVIGFHFDDPLNAPTPAVGFRGLNDTVTRAGLGDLYLNELIAQQGANFPETFSRLFSCEAAGLRAVYAAAGAPEGPLQPIDPPLVPVDPASADCFGQRVTNRAMVAGIGLDFSLANGTPIRIELDSALATQLVPQLSERAGGTPSAAQTAQYQVDMARIAAVARLTATSSPDGVELASGVLPPLLGIQANGHFVKTPLAPYVDPPLPWPGSGGGSPDGDRALALARTFHRGHALDWCNRFHAGSPDQLDVDALRARVSTLQAAQAPAEELEAACAVCDEFAVRHLRIGTDAANYDTSREPLCHFLADDPAATQYVFQPGGAGDDPAALAKGFCGCSCPLAFTGSVSDNIDQTDFTDDLGRTRHGFEHDHYDGLQLTLQPDGRFTASGTFSTESLDEFTFPGDPGETCRTTERQTGSGTVTSYSGTRANPDGSLEASATVTETFEATPCRGMPGSTDMEMVQRTFITSSGIVTPTFTDGCLTGLTWSFFFFDPTTNTTDSTSGQVS